MITQGHIPFIYKPRRWSKAIYHFENVTVKANNSYAKPSSYSSKVTLQMFDITKEHYYFQLNVIESVYQGNHTQKLLRKINMAFDCVAAKVSKKGTIVGVVNIESLQKNWETQKETLKKEYEGPAVSKVFKDIDATLKTERKLTKALRHPKLYGLFFNGYWQLDETSLDTDTTPIVTTDENTTMIEISPSNAIPNCKGYFLYKDNRFVEAALTQNNIKYNALCLG